MALTIAVPSSSDENVQIDKDDPRFPLIRVQEKQQSRRIRKIRQGFRGQQHNWLLWWVRPRLAGQGLDEWLLSNFSQIVNSMPSSVYRLGIEGLVNAGNTDLRPDDDGTFCWILDEKHRITALPECGVIAFFAPPGNLRKAIDPSATLTSWNWSFSGTPFSAQDETAELPYDAEYIRRFQTKFGKGASSTVGIIDTGVCPESDELEGRVIATWAIKIDHQGVPRFDPGPNNDEIGHGTETATIAIGKTLGVAPEANLLSIKLPMRKNGSAYEYRLLDLLRAFEVLRSDLSPAIGGLSALAAIDTLLLPSGLYLARRSNEVKGVIEAVSTLNGLNDIVVVAAIGNTPGRAAFPADEACVLSVGAIDAAGNRWVRSGWGNDSSGRSIPVIHYPGHQVPCQTLNGQNKRSNGTSMAAAGVAGMVTALAKKSRSSRGRWTIIRNSTKEYSDEFGVLPVFVSPI